MCLNYKGILKKFAIDNCKEIASKMQNVGNYFYWCRITSKHGCSLPVLSKNYKFCITMKERLSFSEKLHKYYVILFWIFTWIWLIQNLITKQKGDRAHPKNAQRERKNSHREVALCYHEWRRDIIQCKNNNNKLRAALNISKIITRLW